MKQILKWQADDGREFQEASECKAYESLCADIASIMSAFPKLPKNDECRFANGHGYIQLSEPIVKDVRNRLLDLIATEVNHKWVEESRNMAIHPSWVARLVGETDILPLQHAWRRISCIDNQWREWDQPYYANNPDQGEQVMLSTV